MLTFALRSLVNLKDIHPMLASSAAHLPEGEHWSYEVKWDGYRTLAVKQGTRVPAGLHGTEVLELDDRSLVVP